MAGAGPPRLLGSGWCVGAAQAAQALGLGKGVEVEHDDGAGSVADGDFLVGEGALVAVEGAVVRSTMVRLLGANWGWSADIMLERAKLVM